MADQKVIGFDPATTASGWAVLASDMAGSSWIVDRGVYKPPGTDRLDRLARLAEIYAFTFGLVDRWAPGLVAVESVHHGPNAQTTIKLAEVGAVVRLAAYHARAQVMDVSPAERLPAVGIMGRATKADVVAQVNRVFQLIEDPITDHNIADAVAVASAGISNLRLAIFERW